MPLILSFRLFGNMFGLRFDIKVSVMGYVERVNQSLIAVRCFFKFTYVDGQNGDIREHLVQSLHYFLGKVCLLFRSSAFHNISKDVDEILFVFSQLVVLERTKPDFYIVFCKET